jgi:peptidyl-prolyl cis-trans isomerase SurA
MKNRRLGIGLLSINMVFLWLMSAVPSGQAELVDRIVAIVNEDIITLSELDETVELYAMQVRNSLHGAREEEKVLSKLREDILNRMIDEKLADQESQRVGVSVEESEIDQRMAQMAVQQSMSKEALNEALEAEGFTWEEYRNRLREQMLRMKLINMEVKSKIAITEKEIEDYYEKHKETFQKEKKYRLRMILVKVPSSGGAHEMGAALKKMEAVVEQFEKGVAFKELARRYSEAGTAKDGGDLGFFALDELSSEFRETVRGMKEGEISPILQTPLGYQVVMLEQIKTEAGKPLEDAKLQIQEKLYNEMVEEKYNTWLTELRDRSYIKIIPE